MDQPQGLQNQIVTLTCSLALAGILCPFSHTAWVVPTTYISQIASELPSHITFS